LNIEFSPLCLGRLDKCNLLDEMHELCDSLHLDYMDGNFVPNKAFSIESINSFKSNKPIHVHLMCKEPKLIAKQLRNFDSVSAHIETCEKFTEFMQYMIKNKFNWGVAISPETELEKIFKLNNEPSRVLLMAVKPGYSGQPFLSRTLERIIKIREFWPNIDIVVDGGMHKKTIKECHSLEANSFVICTDLVKSRNKSQYIKDLKENIQR